MLRWGWCCAVLFLAVPAAAQDSAGGVPVDEAGELPTAILQRPLTLPQGVLAITPAVLFGRQVERFDWSAGGTLRLAVGLLDQWELAIEPFPFQLDAGGGAGALSPGGRGAQLWSPRFDTTVHIFETPGTVDWAFDGGALLPLPNDGRGLRSLDLQHRANNTPYVYVGTYVRIPAGILRVDLGGRLVLINSFEGDVVNELRVEALVQPLPELAFGLRVAQGTLLGDSSPVPVLNPVDPFAPLDVLYPVDWYFTVGASVIGTVRPSRDAPLIDLGLDVFFPLFFYRLETPTFVIEPGGPPIPATTPSTRNELDVLQILVTVTVHLDLTGRPGSHAPPRPPPAANEPPERWVIPPDDR